MDSTRRHLGSEFGLTLAGMRQRWRRVLDDRLRPQGLTEATWRTMVYLLRGQDGCLQKDLAFAIGIEGPSLVRLLDTLEEAGFLERRAAAGDRRAKTVHMTPAGETRMADVQDMTDTIRDHLLGDISDDELRLCEDVFRRIRDNAEKAG